MARGEERRTEGPAGNDSSRVVRLETEGNAARKPWHYGYVRSRLPVPTRRSASAGRGRRRVATRPYPGAEQPGSDGGAREGLKRLRKMRAKVKITVKRGGVVRKKTFTVKLKAPKRKK